MSLYRSLYRQWISIYGNFIIYKEFFIVYKDPLYFAIPVGMGDPNKERETAFGSSATIVAKTVTHSKFQSYSLRLQQTIYKNVLYKYYVYIIAQIKLYFCGIASPEGGIHWLLLKSFAWLPNLEHCGWDILAGDHPNSEQDGSFLASLFMLSLFHIEIKCVL